MSYHLILEVYLVDMLYSKPLLYKQTVEKIKAPGQCLMLSIKEQVGNTVPTLQVATTAVEKQSKSREAWC